MNDNHEHGNQDKVANEDPLDGEIDFSNGRPNPYFVAAVGARYVRVIDEDLADLFPDNASMNSALRSLGKPPRGR